MSTFYREKYRFLKGIKTARLITSENSLRELVVQDMVNRGTKVSFGFGIVILGAATLLIVLLSLLKINSFPLTIIIIGISLLMVATRSINFIFPKEGTTEGPKKRTYTVRPGEVGVLLINKKVESGTYVMPGNITYSEDIYTIDSCPIGPEIISNKFLAQARGVKKTENESTGFTPIEGTYVMEYLGYDVQSMVESNVGTPLDSQVKTYIGDAIRSFATNIPVEDLILQTTNGAEKSFMISLWGESVTPCYVHTEDYRVIMGVTGAKEMNQPKPSPQYVNAVYIHRLGIILISAVITEVIPTDPKVKELFQEVLRQKIRGNVMAERDQVIEETIRRRKKMAKIDPNQTITTLTVEESILSAFPGEQSVLEIKKINITGLEGLKHFDSSGLSKFMGTGKGGTKGVSKKPST